MALYMKAAEILDKVEKKKGAVKTLVYDSKCQVILCYVKELRNNCCKQPNGGVFFFKYHLACLSEYKAALCPRV